MDKVTAYAALSARIAAHFRRGMRTNAFLPAEQWKQEIEAGTLYMQETETGLYVFRKRSTHGILSFWLNGEPENSGFPHGTVTEIVWRAERDTALAALPDAFVEQGFTPLFCRMRMQDTADGGDVPENPAVYAADATDFSAVQTLLWENFDERTACLPTEDALRKALAEQRILLYGDDPRHPAGLLHYTENGRKSELRHLCVTEHRRGQGIGQALVQAYRQKTPGQLRQVWVRRDFAPAVHVYEKNGFAPDDTVSAVLGMV